LTGLIVADHLFDEQLQCHQWWIDPVPSARRFFFDNEHQPLSSYRFTELRGYPRRQPRTVALRTILRAFFR
jgi:hypothetical protein